MVLAGIARAAVKVESAVVDDWADRSAGAAWVKATIAAMTRSVQFKAPMIVHERARMSPAKWHRQEGVMTVVDFRKG